MASCSTRCRKCSRPTLSNEPGIHRRLLKQGSSSSGSKVRYCSRRLTLPSSGRFPAGCARFQPPLMSNVRPPRRHMTHRHASAALPCAKGAAAKSASGCPSAGGQRTIKLSHRALSQSSARASESCMAQRSVQRLEGLQHLSLWSLAGALPFTCHHRPNPAIELTASSGLRPPPAAAHVKR